MVQVAVDPDALRIRLSPMDAVLSLHSSFELPFEHVVAARVEDENGWHHLWRKVYGTNAPGLKMAGTFYLPEGLAFLDYSSGSRCLVIETRHERYRTIIVQLGPDADVDGLAAEINQRAQKQPEA
jgi:hypothetical protein